MREGVKIVVALMVALIVAFALILTFSERMRGTDENIIQPREKEMDNSFRSLCKTLHGNEDFLVTGDISGTCNNDDCGSNIYATGSTTCTDVPGGTTTLDKCCCKCK